MKRKHIAKRGAEQRERQLFLGRKGIIVGGHVAVIPLWGRDRAARVPKAQAWFSRSVGSRRSRIHHRQWKTAEKSRTFVSYILRLVKACAVWWYKLSACFSEHIFDQRDRQLVSRVTACLNIRDHVSMKTGRRNQVQNRPIQCSAQSELAHLSQARVVQFYMRRS
jgi:hypothetical protein